MSDTTISDIATTPDAWAGYVPPSDISRPPNPAIYSFQRLLQEDYDFTKGRFTYEGVEYAYYNFRAAIQGGESNGRTAFGGCNTMVGKFRPAATIQDFILACSSALRPSLADLDACDKAMDIVLGPFQSKTDWEFRDKDEKVTFLTGGRSPKIPKKLAGLRWAVDVKDAAGVVIHAAGSKYEVPKVDKATGLIDYIQKSPYSGQDVGANLVMTYFVVPKIGSGSVIVKPAVTVATGAMAPAAG